MTVLNSAEHVDIRQGEPGGNSGREWEEYAKMCALEGIAVRIRDVCARKAGWSQVVLTIRDPHDRDVPIT